MTRELPSGWAWAKFGELVEQFQNGLSKRSGADGDPVPVLRLADIKNGEIDNGDARAIRLTGDEVAAYTLRRGDLVITRVNGSASLVGRFLLFDSEQHWAYCDHFIRARIIPEGALPRFIGWFFEAPQTRSIIESSFVSTAGQKTISQGTLSAIDTPLPPLAEQRRIVARIEALLERVQRAREALEAIPPLLDRTRQSLLAAAFRGELTAAWRAQHPEAETAERLLARLPTGDYGRRGETPLPDTRWTAHHPIPATWAWASLARVAEIKGGLAKGKKRSDREAVRPVPYLRVANVQRGYLDLSEMKEIEATDAEIGDLLLRPGDILFNEGGDRDKLGRGWVWDGQIDPCIHQNHVFRARPLSPEFEPRLLSMYGNTFGQAYFLGEGKQTTNLASISKSTLSALPVPVIPIAEQKVLWRELDAQLTRLDALEALVRQQLAELPTLTQSILAKAFRGELVPQDPTDEPASVLLARIRAERAATAGAPKKKPGRPAGRPKTQPKEETGMPKTRKEVPPDHLRAIVASRPGKSVKATELFRLSDMGLDEFYKQLATEMKPGGLRHGADKETLELADAA